MSQFIHLHTHTEYSLLDGAAKIQALVDEVARLEQPAVAITDHGNMFGAMSLYKTATKAGVKPILGIEAYVAPESRFTKSQIRWGTPDQRGSDVSNGAYTHLTLLALNAQGLKNLYKLHKLSYVEGYYYKPRIDHELLSEYGEGVACLTGCAGSGTSIRLRLGQHREALASAGKLQDIFGDRLYLEVMDHGIDFEAQLNADLLAVGSDLGLTVVPTNDTHYVHSSDSAVHDALLCLQTGAKLADEKRFRFSGSGFYVKSADEMSEVWPDYYHNTLEVASRVESYATMFEHRNLMPVSLEGYTLRQAITEILERDGWGPDYWDRAMSELRTIEDMGYADYFIVVADIVRWAKSQNIMVGPGRGSAGGSLLAYLLDITTIDPIRFGLLFERFISKTRVSPPDVDLDFADDRRHEVIAYIVHKYGSDKVAQLITRGTIKSKAALKDANRVLGGSYGDGEQLVSMVPKPIFGREHALEGLSDLRNANPEVYDLALGLEGLMRSEGKHAAGVVISPEPLDDLVPVKQGPKDEMIVTGFTQTQLEDLGLQKIDCLGLINLTNIAKTLELIGDTAPDMEALELDDQRVFSLLARGETIGIFQVESPAMQRVIKKVKPSGFEDIASVVALWRPGAMAHVDEFAQRKNGH